MNAITLLKQDHRNVEALFERFFHTDDASTRHDIVDKIVEHLSVHAAVEEQAFYPVVRERVPDLEPVILAGLEEHHVTKWLLDELRQLPAGSPRIEAKVRVLQTGVEHHVQEEENVVFAKVLDALALEELEALGATLETAKATAPTRPHPRTPSEPPLNVVIGTAMAIVDRAVQTGRDTVDRILHRTGS